MTAVAVGGIAVLLVNVAGQVFAYDDRCPHAGNPLSLGALLGDILVCAAHEWSFDCRIGRGVGPTSASLLAYDVRVDGGVIAVLVDGAGTPQRKKPEPLRDLNGSSGTLSLPSGS